MWTVVIFIKENTIETIPMKWLLGNEENLAYWPAIKGVKLNSMIVNCAEPMANWGIYEIRFPNNIKKPYDNFLKARNACSRKAEESDIVSECDYSDKRKRKARKISSSDEEENCGNSSKLPSPPAPPGKASSPVLKQSRNSQQLISSEISMPSTPKSSCSVDIIMDCDYNISDVMGVTKPVEKLKNYGDFEMLKENAEPSRKRSLASKGSSRTNDTDNRILRQLVLINHKVDLLSSDVNEIIAKLCTEDTVTLQEDTEIENYFPLKTEELSSFEVFLLDDRNHKKFIQYITNLGGASLAEAVRRAMERVFKDELIQQYSWYGQKQKKIFGVLNISKGIRDGIKRNKLIKDSVTESNVEVCLKNWMRHAKDRINKRAKKAAMDIGELH